MADRESSIKDVTSRLKKLSNPSTFELDPADFARTLTAESDRGAVILAVTAIDDALQIKLKSVFSSANRSDSDRMFDFRGPAGTFSARIALAKALGIIDGKLRDEIDVLRHFRNACAHAQNALSFDSQEARDILSLLVKKSSEPIGNLPATFVRSAFVLACILIASFIRRGEADEGAFEAVKPIMEPLMLQMLSQLAQDISTRNSPHRP